MFYLNRHQAFLLLITLITFNLSLSLEASHQTVLNESKSYDLFDYNSVKKYIKDTACSLNNRRPSLPSTETIREVFGSRRPSLPSTETMREVFGSRRSSLNDITDVVMTSTSQFVQEVDPSMTYIKDTLISSSSWLISERRSSASSLNFFFNDGASSVNISLQF